MGSLQSEHFFLVSTVRLSGVFTWVYWTTQKFSMLLASERKQAYEILIEKFKEVTACCDKRYDYLKNKFSKNCLKKEEIYIWYHILHYKGTWNSLPDTPCNLLLCNRYVPVDFFLLPVGFYINLKSLVVVTVYSQDGWRLTYII